MADFDKAFTFIITHEGGYVNDPNDPGGETKYGISKRQYPDLDIKRLTLRDAREIYFNDYWRAIRGDDIRDQEIANQIFDFAVNAGVRRAVKYAQSVVGVKIDGIMGPITLDAINGMLPEMFLNYYRLSRIHYYYRLAKYTSYRNFLYGWIKRVFDKGGQDGSVYFTGRRVPYYHQSGISR